MVELSKSMSFILRHGATEAGIKISSDGYILVSDLLAWDKIKKHKASFEEIKEVVENNEKKRFEFNEDKTLIRAAQGHT